MAPQRILVVDDDVDALRLVGLLLEHKGYAILAAASGQQGIQKAIEEQPALIILDVMMPDMDGYQVATELRRHPATETIPILMFTAKSGVNDRIAGYQAGADDYLTKPIRPADLIARVETLLAKSEHTRTGDQAGKGMIVGFLPSKGGLGTSTLALNTAIELKRMHTQKEVAFIELASGGCTTALQLALNTPGGLPELLRLPLPSLNKDRLAKEMVHHSTGVHMLLGTRRPFGLGPALSKEFVRTILRYLSTDHDVILVDLPRVLDAACVEALTMADELIVTIDSSQESIALAQTMLAELDALEIDRHRTRLALIHRAPASASFSRNTVEDQLQREMIAGIPQVPDLVQESVQTGRPLVLLQPQALVTQQIRRVVQAIVHD